MSAIGALHLLVIGLYVILGFCIVLFCIRITTECCLLRFLLLAPFLFIFCLFFVSLSFNNSYILYCRPATSFDGYNTVLPSGRLSSVFYYYFNIIIYI